jgi:enoyl-CoA hydratase/carnithine racemase
MANSASHATLDYSARDRVAYATFARPERQNSLSEQALDDLNDVIAQVQADQQLRTLVLRGEGEAFSVGLDPDLLAAAFGDLEYYEHVLTRVAATCFSFEALDVPVIAAVNGTASAAGFELALACDLIVIADDALIGDGGGMFGRVPGGGATVRLPRTVGVQHAREIVYSARMLTGSEAAAIGLALRSVPAAELEAAVEAVAASFTSRSRRALATAKRQINGGLGLDTPSGVEHERSEFIKYLREPGSDAIEGFRAEQEDRPPSWV